MSMATNAVGSLPLIVLKEVELPLRPQTMSVTITGPDSLPLVGFKEMLG